MKFWKAVEKTIEDIGFEIKPDSHSSSRAKRAPVGASPDKAITTNPAIIDAVCTILNRHKCVIFIGESCGFVLKGGVMQAFKEAGIADIANKHNAKLVSFNNERLKKYKTIKLLLQKRCIYLKFYLTLI